MTMAKKLMSGTELSGYIKARQAKQVRALRQAHGIIPKLAIVQVKDDPVINTYVRLKKAYGADIMVEVEVYSVAQTAAKDIITKLNTNPEIHGIIIQLPLSDPSQTDEICDMVIANKDVDALGKSSIFEPATPMAIMWLLAGYNVDLRGKKILIIGQGKLVGEPLAQRLKDSGHDVTVANRQTKTLNMLSIEADILITAAGSPAILFSNMIKQGAVVVDAGTASEDGKTVGDLAPEVYERDDLVLTPPKGGVGPLTVCALFENVIRSAGNFAEKPQ
jgi:methylenetetrahydrofolate dehydrogenase (NADP+)/methenyltetrahydrofolate cyclohydrolase